MNSKSILEVSGGFLVETIRSTRESEGWLQETSVMGSVYGKKAAIGWWRSRMFLFFVGDPLNIFEVHDSKKGVLLKEQGLQIRGDMH